ncbi:MAG TPA: SRPBCC domain-containing protein [Myxococcales bacterium]|nr:SRPBCC domain-containing protein [Myxococcales bacterium]
MKVLKVAGAVIAAVLIGGFIYVQTGTNVRQLRDHATLTPDGKAQRTREKDALDYAVATKISAPPEVVWSILTDAKGYTSWNSTVLKVDGDIALGSTVKLVTKSAPDRTFALKVSEFTPPKTMVWEDGGKAFMGVRRYSLLPNPDGTTTFAMSETLSGRMLSMIEPSLPDFTPSFETIAADLKRAAEAKAAGNAQK